MAMKNVSDENDHYKKSRISVFPSPGYDNLWVWYVCTDVSEKSRSHLQGCPSATFIPFHYTQWVFTSTRERYILAFEANSDAEGQMASVSFHNFLKNLSKTLFSIHDTSVVSRRNATRPQWQSYGCRILKQLTDWEHSNGRVFRVSCKSIMYRTETNGQTNKHTHTEWNKNSG